MASSEINEFDAHLQGVNVYYDLVINRMDIVAYYIVVTGKLVVLTRRARLPAQPDRSPSRLPCNAFER